MKKTRHKLFIIGIALLVACGSDETIPFDPFANVTDVRSEYTVSTLTDQFFGSGGLTVDVQGNIYVANFGNSLSIADGTVVRKVDPVSGELSIFVNGLQGPSGNTFDNEGNLIQANIQGNFVSKITPDGESSMYSSDGLISPVGVAFDSQGNLFVCNCGGGSIQKITPSGASSVFVSSSLFNCPNGLTVDDDDNLYAANFSDGNIIKISPAGNAEVFVTLPGNSNSHLTFGNGVLYALSRGGHRLYEVTLSRGVSLLAGNTQRGNNDGSGDVATFSIPNGIGLSPDGTKIYVTSRIADTGTSLNPVLVRVVEKK